MEQTSEPVKAEAAFMAAMKEVRKHRGWTQHELARRLEELGVPLGRGAVAKIESVTTASEDKQVRALRWHEALIMAAALGSDPAYLGSGGAAQPDIAVTPKLVMSSGELRQWIRGQLMVNVDSDGDRFPDRLMTDDEWVYRQRQYIGLVYKHAEALVAAVEAGDEQARRDAVEALQAEADRHRMFEEMHGGVSSAGRRYPGSR